MANETNLCTEESWTVRTRNGGGSGWCGSAFSKFPAQLSCCMFSISQTFAPRLTTSRHMSLFCATYFRQLVTIPKDFMETFSVSLKCLFWPACSETVNRRAVSSGGSDLSCGQHDRPNDAVIASRWCRCWEEKPELKLRCLGCIYIYIY